MQLDDSNGMTSQFLIRSIMGLPKIVSVDKGEPKNWTEADKFLNKSGVFVRYYENSDKKILEKYDSRWLNQKLNQIGNNLTEEDLIENVDTIFGDCDLRSTTLKNLQEIKNISGSLILDTNSPLEDLSSLEKAPKHVLVYAKNKNDMNEFLEKTNFPKEICEEKPKLIVKNFI